MLPMTLLLLSQSVAADDTVPVIPEKLINHHRIACPEFNSDDGRILLRAEYTLPSSPNTQEVKKLYVLGCEMYAYNSLEKAYILNATGDITDVYVAVIDYEGSLTATSDLMGADYDEISMLLGTFQKRRGMGDCGSTSAYSYSPELEKFILMQTRLKQECDGIESYWPVIYSKE